MSLSEKLNENSPLPDLAAAIFFSGLAYLVAIFGYFIVWPAIHGT